MSDDIQKKIREELAALHNSKVAKQSDARLAGNEARINNPDFIAKMKALGKNEEANKARSKASKELWQDKDKVDQILEKRKATIESDEYQDKKKKIYSDPERLKKVIAGGRTQAKSFTTPEGVFDASTDAAKHYGLTPRTMRQRAKLKPHLYYYTEDGPGKPLPPKPKPVKEKYVRRVETPDGVFDNIRDAGNHYNVHPDTIKYRIRNVDGYRWLDDKFPKKQVMTPNGVFESLDVAAAHYDKTPKTITRWMKSRPTEFYQF
jgi:hypothetical protein